MCVLSLTEKDTSEHQKAQTWTRKMQPRLPFKLHITSCIWQTIDLIEMTLSTLKKQLGNENLQTGRIPDVLKDSNAAWFPPNSNASADKSQRPNESSGGSWCPKCNQGARALNAKFCYVCGSRIVVPLTSASQVSRTEALLIEGLLMQPLDSWSSTNLS